MNYLSTDAFARVAYEKTGTGPALVLVHGFPESGKLWKEIVPSLSAHFTVLVPDLPGSGESIDIGTDISIDQLADSIYALLEHEQIESAVVAGHSMGGYTALALAAKHPERIKGLSMVHSTAAADDEEKKETRRKSIALIQKGAKDTFIKQMVPNLFSLVTINERKEMVERQVSESLKLAEISIIGFYTAMMNRPDSIEVIKSAAYPIQWIAGKDDTVIPIDKALQQSYLAAINFVSVYDKCGHMSMLEQSGKLAADLQLFTTYCYNR